MDEVYRDTWKTILAHRELIAMIHAFYFFVKYGSTPNNPNRRRSRTPQPRSCSNGFGLGHDVIRESPFSHTNWWRVVILAAMSRLDFFSRIYLPMCPTRIN